MNKKFVLISLSAVTLLIVTIGIFAQTGNLPFTIFSEEQGQHDGNHQFPLINGTIKVNENYSGNLTSLAKISKSTADVNALNYTTGGQIISSELNIENNYLVWKVVVNFNNINYELLIDAGNGKVLWASQQTNESE